VSFLALLPTVFRLLPWGLCVVLFAMWQWDRADLAEEKAGSEAAVVAAQTKADALAAKLTDAEARADAVTQQKVITYVDRIQASPDDAARNLAGSLGVRDIIHSGSAASPSGPAAGVSGSGAGGGPK
jgi:hypothetical protein